MVNCAAEEESGRTFLLSLNCIKRGLETFSETKKCPKMSTLLFFTPFTTTFYFASACSMMSLNPDDSLSIGVCAICQKYAILSFFA